MNGANASDIDNWLRSRSAIPSTTTKGQPRLSVNGTFTQASGADLYLLGRSVVPPLDESIPLNRALLRP